MKTEQDKTADLVDYGFEKGLPRVKKKPYTPSGIQHRYLNHDLDEKFSCNISSGRALGHMIGTVNDRPVRMLIDSGSTFATIDKSLYDSFIDVLPLKPFSCPVQCAGEDQVLTTYGYFTVTMSVGQGEPFLFEVLVAKLNQEEVIFGLNLLQALEVVQDYGRDDLFIDGIHYSTTYKREPEEVRFARMAAEDLLITRCRKTVTLPPKQMKVVRARTKGRKWEDKDLGLLTPNMYMYTTNHEDFGEPKDNHLEPDAHYKEYPKFLPCIVTMNAAGSCSVGIYNPSDTYQILEKGTVLGEVEPVTEDEIEVVEGLHKIPTTGNEQSTQTKWKGEYMDAVPRCFRAWAPPTEEIPPEEVPSPTPPYKDKDLPETYGDPIEYIIADDDNVWKVPPDDEVDLNEQVPEHLDGMMDRMSTKLTVLQGAKVKTMLNRYLPVFAGPDTVLKQTPLVQHTINTGKSPPIKQAPRRVPFIAKGIMDEQVEKMLKEGIIRHSNSPWASPVVLVKKKDGTTRFCVDYRRLNDITHKDAFPIPRLETCLEAFAGAKWFSTLDLQSSYWQISMDEKDIEKTAFCTPSGLYEFTVMPFGLTNAPATFQRFIQMIMTGLAWDQKQLYIDDIIAPGKTFEESLQNIAIVLHRLLRADLTVKPSKCDLFQESVAFLGHIVSEEGVSCDPKKLKAVAEWPTPHTLTELRSFIGFCSYYRKFIPQYSHICYPLYKLFKKSEPWVWDNEQEQAFLTLQEVMMTPPILAYPQPLDPDCPEDSVFHLDTDASRTGLGAVLSQVQDGIERVIAYWSRTTNKAEENYCPTYLELLAVKCACEYFHNYLWGRKFVVRTDHASLTWLLNFKMPEGILARWLSNLTQYDMEIVHRPGRKHGNADGLSRKRSRPCPRSDCGVCSQLREMRELKSHKKYQCRLSIPKQRIDMQEPWVAYRLTDTEVETDQYYRKEVKSIMLKLLRKSVPPKGERRFWDERMDFGKITTELEKLVRKKLGQKSETSSSGDSQVKCQNTPLKSNDSKPNTPPQWSPSLVVEVPESSLPTEIPTESNEKEGYQCPGIGDNTFVIDSNRPPPEVEIPQDLSYEESPKRLAEDIQQALLEDILTNLNGQGNTDPDDSVPLIVILESDSPAPEKEETIIPLEEHCQNSLVDPVLPVKEQCQIPAIDIPTEVGVSELQVQQDLQYDAEDESSDCDTAPSVVFSGYETLGPTVSSVTDLFLVNDILDEVIDRVIIQTEFSKLVKKLDKEAILNIPTSPESLMKEKVTVTFQVPQEVGSVVLPSPSDKPTSEFVKFPAVKYEFSRPTRKVQYWEPDTENWEEELYQTEASGHLFPDELNPKVCQCPVFLNEEGIPVVFVKTIYYKQGHDTSPGDVNSVPEVPLKLPRKKFKLPQRPARRYRRQKTKHILPLGRHKTDTNKKKKKKTVLGKKNFMTDTHVGWVDDPPEAQMFNTNHAPEGMREMLPGLDWMDANTSSHVHCSLGPPNSEAVRCAGMKTRQQTKTQAPNQAIPLPPPVETLAPENLSESDSHSESPTRELNLRTRLSAHYTEPEIDHLVQGPPPQTNPVMSSEKETDEELARAVKACVPKYNLTDLRALQLDDEDLKVILQAKEKSSRRPDWSTMVLQSADVKAYWTIWDQVVIHNRCLYRKQPPSLTSPKSYLRLFAPKTIRKELMLNAHDRLTAGHFGITKTYNKIKKHFYWVRCKSDIKQWCRTCSTCATVKPSTEARKVPLVPMPCGRPWERVGIDLIGPLPESENGSEYCLVMEDYFSKWPEAFPLKNKEAKTVATAIYQYFLTRFAHPLTLHSDQGREFCNQILEEVCKVWDMNKTRTTAYHPSGDGLVERTNRTLQVLLCMAKHHSNRDWEEILTTCLLCLRSTENESTTFTPYMILHGEEMRTPFECQYVNEDPKTSFKCHTLFVHWMITTLQECHTLTRLAIGRAVTRQKTSYDRATSERQFYIGELFYIKNFTREKLDLLWLGPHRVTGRPNDVTIAYRIRNRDATVHINNVKRCLDDEPRVLPPLQQVPTARHGYGPLLEHLPHLFGTTSLDSDYSDHSQDPPIQLPQILPPPLHPPLIQELPRLILELSDPDPSSDAATDSSSQADGEQSLVEVELTQTRRGRIVHRPSRYLS